MLSSDRLVKLIGSGVRCLYRLVQKKGTVLLSTSLSWPALAGCRRAETFSQLSSKKFTTLCTYGLWSESGFPMAK